MSTRTFQNITFSITEHARNTPLATAIVLDDRILTYLELDGLVSEMHHWLYETGARPGMTITLRFRNQVDLLIAMLALMRMGVTAFPVSPNIATPHLQKSLQSAASNLLISDFPEQHNLGIRFKSFDKLPDSSLSWTPEIHSDSEATCLLISGSGTTGNPRLIPISHRVMHARAQMLRDIWNLQSSDRVMVLSPLHFATPTYRIISALSMGATAILWSNRVLTPSNIIYQKPDILHLSVFHAEQLLTQKTISDTANFESVRIVSIGASTVTERLRSRLKDELRARLHINYGTNETLSIAFAYPDDLSSVPASVGRPPKGVNVEILDDQKRPVGAGQVGHLRVKSPAQVTSYFHEEENARFQDGWFYPGDLAKWTEDGQILHYGRSDHMMIMNGINIYPSEIERVLELNSAVHEAVVVPFPHHIMQDIPAAAIVLRRGHETTSDEIIEFARSHLGARAPKIVVFLDAIPKNEQGKSKCTELFALIDEKIRERQERLEPNPITLDVSRIGNHKRLIQPQIKINIHFTLPKKIMILNIDEWIEVLNPNLSEYAYAIEANAENRRSSEAAAWAERICLVSCEILQVAGFPVFDRPQVLSCKWQTNGNDAWGASISIAAIENTSLSVYKTAFSVASQVMLKMMREGPQHNNREEIFEHLLVQGITPLKALAQGGKSTLPLLHAAHKKDIPFYSLGGGIYQLGQGAKARRVDRSTTDTDKAHGQKLSGSKLLCAHILRLSGLPGAINGTADSVETARTLAERIGWPVVIKPEDRERGEGVSVDVDHTTLETAFQEAQKFTHRKSIIVEQQAQGVCHRLFIASGRLLYAVKRLPIGIYGDGVKTITQLAAEEFTAQKLLPPWRRSKLSHLDELAYKTMAACGYLPNSIPEMGRFVPFRRIETTAFGGVDEDVTANVHPENQRIAICAADLLGLDVAGVDIISTNICEPWYKNGAIINEVNFSPLLGGGEISRGYLNEYLSRLIEDDGRIPIDIFIGREIAWRSAMMRQNEIGGTGAGLYITRADLTIDEDGKEIKMPFISLAKRVKALLLLKAVKALIVVVDDTETLKTRFMNERVNAVYDSNETLLQHQDRSARANPQQSNAVRQIIRKLADGKKYKYISPIN